MKYAVWMRQNGEGCDYTIACGESLVALEASTLSEARGAALEAIREYTGSERHITEAMILTVVEDVSAMGDTARREFFNEIDEREREKKRAMIRKLKRELGEE